MDLKCQESIILGIGDLKLSDTHDTFGERKTVNGISYIPMANPRGEFYYPVSAQLAHGDAREGVIICKDKNKKVFVTYGANRPTSNAQSLAIGYEDENGFFFIMENYRDIYDKNPSVSSREIIRTKLVYEQHGSIKRIYLYWDPNYGDKIDKADETQYKKLLSIIEELKDAFRKDYLSKLRLRP